MNLGPSNSPRILTSDTFISACFAPLLPNAKLNTPDGQNQKSIFASCGQLCGVGGGDHRKNLDSTKYEVKIRGELRASILVCVGVLTFRSEMIGKFVMDVAGL